jgi:monofunctional biosynthetic peptidoglycan transglycosylase
VHGASTISQQVAKNLFLWSGRGYFRKGIEAYFTVLIEACWPKRRILEIYLNIAEFSYGIYGAEAAAQRFFHKTAARLTRSDAALLAAVLPNPQRLLVSAPSRYIEQRRAWILDQMQALGGPEMLGEIDAYPDRHH